MTVARAFSALAAAALLGAAAYAGASSSPARASGSAHPRIFLDGSTLSPPAAAAYGAKGATILGRMSAPPGDPHSPDPLRDSGYGIRFYGLGMAIGFDWLYDALAPSRRTRVVAAINRWIGAFQTGGFERDFPQGNYFAGYYAAKGIGALATEDDNPQAPTMWNDWLTRVHGRMVRPYYAQN